MGIIALFIVLIYGFAALTLGINGSLTAAERLPLVWFLVTFPLVVLCTFGWLVSRHHEKLYSPGDYKSDEGFHRSAQTRIRHTAEIQAQQDQLKSRVRATVFASNIPNVGAGEEAENLIQRISQDIDQATTITVDATEFLRDPTAVHVFPIAAFENLNDLMDEVYFKIAAKVKPFEYGFTWLLRDAQSCRIVRNARMITGLGPGMPLPDLRPLSDVNIQPGSRLIVEAPT